MQRELLSVAKYRNWNVCGCCPGHDIFPNDTYKNNRSKRARSRDIKVEHRIIRRTKKQELYNELYN